MTSNIDADLARLDLERTQFESLQDNARIRVRTLSTNIRSLISSSSEQKDLLDKLYQDRDKARKGEQVLSNKIDALEQSQVQLLREHRQQLAAEEQQKENERARLAADQRAARIAKIAEQQRQQEQQR